MALRGKSMDYYVLMRSLKDIGDNIKLQLDNWKNELSEVVGAIEAYESIASIQGATGEALNEYMESVHKTIISAIGTEFDSYSEKITSYVNDYFALESSEEGIIWSSIIQSQMDMIPGEKTAVDEIASSVTEVISSVADIVSPSVIPDMEPVKTAYDNMTIFLEKLDEAIVTLETNHSSDMEDCMSLISTLKGIIEPNMSLSLTDVPVNKVGDYLKEYLKDIVTLGVYDSFASCDTAIYLTSPAMWIEVERHYKHNCKEGWKAYLKKTNVPFYKDENGNTHLLQCGKGFYIEYQGEMDEILYGLDFGEKWNQEVFGQNELRARSNACEVIATYNAMAYLNGGYSPVEFPDLLREYEGNGTALLGNWGASPSGVDACLKRYGYETKFVTGPDLEQGGEGYEKLQSQYDVYIMSSWNREGKITKGVHTMAITKEENGKFFVHNSFSDNPKEYDSLESAVLSYHKGESDPISLIGVSKK